MGVLIMLVRESPMPKALSLVGLVVSVLVLIVFGLDAAAKIPFGQHSMAMDIGFAISALILAYMSWMTYREQV